MTAPAAAAATFRRTSDNLVIVRAGPRSLHPSWLTGGERSFDLLVSAYSAATPRSSAPGVLETRIDGTKLAGYAATLAAHRGLIERYARVALIDDDIAADAPTLSRTFRLGASYGLRLWQPSLSWDSYFTYAGTLSQRRSFVLRYVNFVEMMCPFFDTGHLFAVAPLLDGGYETGIDRVWHRSGGADWFRMAVIDAASVRHTRPVGRDKTANGFAADERYDRQIALVERRFDHRFRGMIAYAGIATDDRLVRGGLAMAARAAGLFAAVGATPLARRTFFRFVSDHIRHCAFRRAELAPAPLDLR